MSKYHKDKFASVSSRSFKPHLCAGHFCVRIDADSDPNDIYIYIPITSMYCSYTPLFAISNCLQYDSMLQASAGQTKGSSRATERGGGCLQQAANESKSPK